MRDGALEATVSKGRLGSLPWLVVTGSRTEAFRELGSCAATHIRDVVEHMSALPKLQARTRDTGVAAQLVAVRKATQERFPGVWSELEALARGAGVDFEKLVLLNFRGDLGRDDGEGCTDIGWSDGTRAMVGHNEDGDPSLNGNCHLLTLLLDGEPAVTTYWYPGFVPGNTFSVNSHGLVCSVDNIRVSHAAVAPGRHFVARDLQSSSSIQEAVGRLKSNPSAGGFAYALSQVGRAEVVIVEAAGGSCTAEEASPPKKNLVWHTNHLLHPSRVVDNPAEASLARAALLRKMAVPDKPDVGWFLSTLAGSPYPDGVYRALDGAGVITLCTMVVDLRAALVTLLPSGGQPTAVSLEDLVQGIGRGELGRGPIESSPRPNPMNQANPTATRRLKGEALEHARHGERQAP